MFTQTLICNDKVNDGAYLAVETNFPEGTIANLGDAEGSTGIAWAFLQPAFTGFPRTLSRALQARGFIEEVIGAYSVSGNVIQGGGIDQYGNSSAIMNFEIAAQGMGAKYVLDGTDTCAAMFNPEGDAGDVEMWELICPMIYLSRRIKAEHGRPRAPPRRLELRVAARGLEHALLGAPEPRHRAVFTSQGLFGGYPGSAAYIHNIRGADLRRAGRARARRTRSPTGSFDDPALMAIDGERDLQAGQLHDLLEPFAEGDLYLSVMKGGRRARRPAAARPSRRSSATSPRATSLPRFAESVYGVVATATRDSARGALERAPAGARVVGGRARAGPRRRVDRAGEGRLRGVDEALAALGGRVPRLLGPARGLQLRRRDADGAGRPAPKPGKVTPEESADEFLAASEVDESRAADGRRRARSTARRSRRCSTRSSRGARSRTSSRATRTPTGSRSGSRSCRSGSPTTTRSCCRWARG